MTRNLTHLKQQCRVTGLNANAYLRKLIMNENLRPRPPDTYAALLRELAAIGNNANQIAYWANARKKYFRTGIAGHYRTAEKGTPAY